MEATGATVAAAKPAVETSGELLMLMKGQMDELERHTDGPEPAAAETSPVEEPAKEVPVRTVVAPKLVERVDSVPIITEEPEETTVYADQAAVKPPDVMVEVPAVPEEPIRIQVAEPTIREVLPAEATEPVYTPEAPEYPAEAGFDVAADADIPVQEHDIIAGDEIFLDYVPDEIVLGEAAPEEGVPEGVLDMNEAFDDEVMETFERLRELVDAADEDEEEEAGTVPPAGVDPADRPEPEWAADLKAETPRPVQPETFEELVRVEAEAGEKPGDIEELTSDAAGRPLEETFARLALYLAESDKAVRDSDGTAPQAAETTEAAETAQVIEEALRSVAELLPARSAAELADKDEKSEEKPRVTPELTLKLLTLLRAVGYDRPEEVLLELIRRHSFEFLAQAVHYLYRLCDDDNRWELARSTRSLIIPEPALPLTTRLGKSIIALLTVPRIPETAVAAMGD
jgi:hypothetical protein